MCARVWWLIWERNNRHEWSDPLILRSRSWMWCDPNFLFTISKQEHKNNIKFWRIWNTMALCVRKLMWTMNSFISVDAAFYGFNDLKMKLNTKSAICVFLQLFLILIKKTSWYKRNWFWHKKIVVYIFRHARFDNRVWI